MNEETKSRIYKALVGGLINHGLAITWNSVQTAKAVRIRHNVKLKWDEIAHLVTLLSLPIFAYQAVFTYDSVLVGLTMLFAFGFSLASIAKNKMSLTGGELINTVYQEQVLLDLYRASMMSNKMVDILAKKGIVCTEEVFRESYVEANYAITNDIETILTATTNDRT